MNRLSGTPRNIQIFLFLLLLLIPAQLLANETPEDTAARLQQRYDTIHSLQFDFTQDTRGQLAGRPKTGTGQAFFMRDTTGNKPGMMRWNYTTPDRQVLVSDGVTFSMYFETLKQMIVTDADVMKRDLTYSFFTGRGSLQEDFTISAADEHFGTNQQESKTVIIKLTPKQMQSQVAAIHIWVTEDSLIQRIEILDHFDTLTVLNFSHLKVNKLSPDDPALIKRLFTFVPPEGTEIIEQ